MTDEEKKERMTERNKSICDYYLDGHKLSECASKFKLGRQRVQQIVQAAGVWKPYIKGGRTKFLGVTVTADAKDGLKIRADQKGVSVSQLAADAIDEMLAKES